MRTGSGDDAAVPAAAGHAWIVAFVVLALCAAALPAPAPAQEVTGTVKTEDGGIPMPGVRIWLFRTDHTPVDSSRTNASGRFLLRAPAAGRYMLYVHLPGYASMSTMPFDLTAGQVLKRDVDYQLVSTSAMQIMGDALDQDTMLQRHLPELCGEDPRPWETGLLVGVIRDRPTSKPIPGAVVMVQPPATPDSTPTPKTIVSNAHGTYVFCNVPPGDSVMLRVRAPGHRPENQVVRVRKGMIGWYDVYMRRSRAEPNSPRGERGTESGIGSRARRPRRFRSARSAGARRPGSPSPHLPVAPSPRLPVGLQAR